MDREIRLSILVLVCFISYIVYWFFNIIVLIPDYCSGISAYWLYGDNYWSPFWMFVIVFSLIILWSLVELVDSLILREDRAFTLSVIGVAFIFNACFFAGHYTLWQLMEIQQGKYSANFLFSYKKIESLRNSKRLFDVPEMHFFIKQESCKNGIEVFDLEKEDRQVLLIKYHHLVHKIMESNRKIQPHDEL